MNILIIPSWYPSKGMPVNGIFFKEQAIALAKNGFNVTVVDVTFHGKRDVFSNKNFRLTYLTDNGVHTYMFKVPSFYFLSRIKLLHILIYKTLLFYVLKKICAKGYKFDIIHAHSFYPAGYCACELSKKHNIPLIVTEHNTDVLEKCLSNYKLTLLKYTLANCKKFICVSESLLFSVEEMYGKTDKLIVIPNMFSSDFAYSEENKIEKTEFCFLSVGFFNERKRHGFAVSCFEKAFRGIANVRFDIIGEGPLYKTLQKQIIESGLKDKVRLLGALDKKQLVKNMKKCDVFILASTFENFGVVYIEAMACGKPVIATKNGGANNIVNDTNGILIEKDNEQQLVEAFHYMYCNANKYNNHQIATDCHAKYSEEVLIGMLFNVYKEACNL